VIARKRLLGLDVGSQRVGVAISDELGMIATPVGFVKPGVHDREEFRKIIERFGATELVAGIPKGMSGREGPQAAEVRTYANSLARDLGLPLTYWDERLTTIIAERSLISGGRNRAQRKVEIDAAAAAVMLQGFLDHQSRRGKPER
jgi:putative Holliday junction resolvase